MDSADWMTVVLVALACLPGGIAMADALIAKSRRFDQRKSEISAAQRISARYGIFKEDLERYRPSKGYTLLGAVMLSSLFVAAALLTQPDDPDLERVIAAPAQAAAQGAGHEPGAASATSTATPALTAPTTAASATPSGERRTADRSSGAAAPAVSATVTPPPPGMGPTYGPGGRRPPGLEARAAFLFTVYGAYVLTLTLLISRVNSSSVTPKFLVIGAARTAASIALGFVAAATGLFAVATTPNQSLFVYFAIGLFPTWALAALRKRAKDLFAPDETGCESLPLCLIDGLDDGIVDRLAEVGIWDIQHLSSAKPLELSIQTLYPLPRVVDWMDQAILISYVRTKIVGFRAAGIRGAIDLRGLYQLSIKPDTANDWARTLLATIKSKTEIPEESLKLIGASLADDTLVKFLRDLWFLKNELGVERAVLTAASIAASTAGKSFDPPPQAGEPIKPPLSDIPQFADMFAQVLEELLRPLDLTWIGSRAGITRNLTWTDLISVVAAAIQRRPKSADGGGSEKQGAEAKTGAKD